MNKKVRDNSLGYLFVVGGPGGSGCSTISKMLKEHFSLKRVYGGKILRDGIKKLGFSSLNEAFKSLDVKAVMSIDKKVDKYLRNIAGKKDVLIESKIFSAIARKDNIPITVSIWIDSSLHKRVMRTFSKDGVKGVFPKIKSYLKLRRDLVAREKFDAERYRKLYGVNYSKPKEWNDIVINSSRLDEVETFNLILKLLKDGGYIK